MAQPEGTAEETEATQQQAEVGRRPTLDLSSIIPEAVPVEEEAYFLLDGERHAYAKITAWSLRQRRTYISAMERIAALEGLPEPTEVDEQEYRKLLTSLAIQLAPSLTPEKVAPLDDGQLADIAMSFFVWLGERHPRMATMGRLGAVGERMAQMRSRSIGAR